MMETKCNICGKTFNYEESNDSFPINYFEKNLYSDGCCSSCNKYVVKCRWINMTFPETAKLLFSNKLEVAELEQICADFDFLNKKLGEPYSARQHIKVSYEKTNYEMMNEKSHTKVPLKLCYEEITSGICNEIEIEDESKKNKIILCYKAGSQGIECVAVLNNCDDKKYLLRHFRIGVGENHSLFESIDGYIEHWEFKVCIHPEDIDTFQICKTELGDGINWELLYNGNKIQYFVNACKQELSKDLDRNKVKSLFSDAINKSDINLSGIVSVFDIYTFSFSLTNGENFSNSFSDIAPYNELIELIKNEPKKNSLELQQRVMELQPQLEILIEAHYIKGVETWLMNIEEHIQELSESIKVAKKLKLRSTKYQKKELKEMKRASKLSGAKKQEYIIEKAHQEMNMLGSCHVIWNIKKRLLKEVYNIDWLTPQEEHPEIMFD